MRVPHEMRLVGLTPHEYQLIGKIAVLSGMIEQQMKEMLVKLSGAPWPDGMAIFAHALIPSSVPDKNTKYSLQQSFRAAIEAAGKAYDGRNKLLHGPFSPWTAKVGARKSTLKTTARGKIQYSGVTFDKKALSELLRDLIEVHDLIFGSVALLEIELGQSNPFPRAFPRHGLGEKASRRTPPSPRRTTRTTHQ